MQLEQRCNTLLAAAACRLLLLQDCRLAILAFVQVITNMSDFVGGEASQNLQGVRQFLNVELVIFSRIILREGLMNALLSRFACFFHNRFRKRLSSI